mmetsp:Transcript_12758/g.22197  ORF Transcript_12758/g.22197 Transcript_12758/m.22197 type:complete len:212 (-) Transcript_12758:316-951(-)
MQSSVLCTCAVEREENPLKDAVAAVSLSRTASTRAKKLDNIHVLDALLESGVPILLVYGKRDTTCDSVGGYALAESLSWHRQDAWENAPMEEWLVEGSRVGKVRSGGGLTWVQIDDAGHMCPADDPRAAYLAIDMLLNDIAKGPKTGFVKKFASNRMGEEILRFQSLPTFVGSVLMLAFVTFIALRGTRNFHDVADTAPSRELVVHHEDGA